MAERLRVFRRFAIVIAAAAAGVLSPPDPISLFIMAALLVVLYEVAILAIDDPQG